MESGPSVSADAPPPPPAPMAAKDDEAARREPSPSAGGGRGLMDVDLDLDNPDSWPFDPLALIASSPPSLGFPSPASPLWLFEDRAFDASTLVSDWQRFLAGNADTPNGNFDGGDSKIMEIQQAGDDDDSSTLYLMKQRMTQALRHLKESTDQHVLVQVWAPVKSGSRSVLTTSGQPFVLDPQSTGLLQYRTVSVTYMFSVDGDNDGDLGLPGRVFRQKMPEWTPNVQYYSRKEYPRLCHALNYNVQGTLALPVFEPSAQFCIGVVELIMTSQKVNYAGEVDKVCKALEAVNLKSSEIMKSPNIQICNEGRLAALAEILKTLTMVCERHNLPFAQTWVPCKHRIILADGGGSRKSCSSFDGSCMGQVCMSTTDVAFHVINARMWGFREACVEHHLQKGQGVAGMSFASHRPCFSKDITRFCKTEYPLVHYARMFELHSCFAICLQSTYTGNDEYLMEFFLPPDCKESDKQRALLKSMITVMTNCFHSLRPSTNAELQDEKALEHLDMFTIEYQASEPKKMYIQNCEGRFSASNEIISNEGLDSTLCGDKTIPEILEKHLSADTTVGENGKISGVSNGSASCNSSFVNKKNKTLEKRRGKAEKMISLEVLQQYFCGSLKDAAKSLGVCPTTMKRICRQHGISRWPSRKINKVNRSLSKLKQVIESVQGADAAFSLTSLTGPLPVGVGSTTWNTNGDELKDKKAAKLLNVGGRYRDTSTHILSHVEYSPNAQRDLSHSHNKIQVESSKPVQSSKSRSSSGQGSTSTPASEGSCHGSPINDTHESNQIASSQLGAGVIKFPSSAGKQCARDPNAFVLHSSSDAILMEPQARISGILVGDSGSSKYLKVLCAPTMEGCHDEDAAPIPSQPMQMQDLITVTIKATYKGNIIRFRLPISSGVLPLRKEISKRLKLDIDMFDIKYMDDDQEWVTLSCNADLEECIEISQQSGGHPIRLLVSDTNSNLGSSCESSRGH
ncbi:protein NLP3 [Canna indica]|uniref:Protein NLP3 n=1 Tax=Canna indica TaxID=4628 RepID=A0AAQ3Q625_9LILI|nr:protein NLP3 [Canna indica]